MVDGPLGAHGHGDGVGLLIDRFQGLEEFVEGFGGAVDAGFLQEPGVEPHDVGAVDVDRDRVDAAFVGDLLGELVGHGLLQALFGEEVVEGLQVAGFDVVLQFGTGVALEGVGRVLALQAALEDGLGVGARSAGDGGVDEVDVGVVLLEAFDEGLESGFLASPGPPGEDLDLGAVPAVASAA